MQMCYIHDKFMFTHAGVTKTFYEDHFGDAEDIEQSINDLFRYKPDSFRFRSGINESNTGDDVTQSPIWVRPRSLAEDMVEGYTHVVGHTERSSIYIGADMKDKLPNSSFILIDTLGTSGEYLIIENGEPRACKLDS